MASASNLARRKFVTLGGMAMVSGCIEPRAGGEAVSGASESGPFAELQRVIPVDYSNLTPGTPRVRWEWMSRDGYGFTDGAPISRPWLHDGIDIEVPTGTKVVAAHEGWATARWGAGGSLNVRIQYSENVTVDKKWYQVETIYGHLSRTHLPFPQSSISRKFVSRGEVIGESGSTGTLSPHLHLGVLIRQPGTRELVPVNPHMFWEAVGRPTCFNASRNYTAHHGATKLVLTYPISCKV